MGNWGGNLSYHCAHKSGSGVKLRNVVIVIHIYVCVCVCRGRMGRLSYVAHKMGECMKLVNETCMKRVYETCV